MGVAWLQDDKCRQEQKKHQELHYLSSYRTQDEALLRVSTSANAVSSSAIVKEKLYISKENTKLTPAVLIEYLTNIIEDPDQTNTPEDVAVFICGTPAYSQMIKDSCAIVSAGIKYYEW